VQRIGQVPDPTARNLADRLVGAGSAREMKTPAVFIRLRISTPTVSWKDEQTQDNHKAQHKDRLLHEHLWLMLRTDPYSPLNWHYQLVLLRCQQQSATNFSFFRGSCARELSGTKAIPAPCRPRSGSFPSFLQDGSIPRPLSMADFQGEGVQGLLTGVRAVHQP
jgi:hypothetical protein